MGRPAFFQGDTPGDLDTEGTNVPPPSRVRPQSAEVSTYPIKKDKLAPQKEWVWLLARSSLTLSPNKNRDSQTYTRRLMHTCHIRLQDTKRNHADMNPTNKRARAVTGGGGGGSAWRRPDPSTPPLIKCRIWASSQDEKESIVIPRTSFPSCALEMLL